MSKATKKLNICKKTVALLLTAILVASLLGVSVFAEGEVTEGKCGNELTWSYANGTLSIFGKGDMQDFTELTMAPWHHLRGEIIRVTLPEGLTSVGDLAFWNCERLVSVTLPKSVQKIGHYSFAGCKGLVFIDVGEALRSIGNAAFYECFSLDAVRLPYGLESIGYEAFFRCHSLSTVTIPENLKKMGASAFAYCTGLVRAEIRSSLNVLPEWTFYGCDLLAVVTMPSTMTQVDNYALKNCDGLSTVYFEGSDDEKESLMNEISKDLPDFGDFGAISSGEPSTSISSSRTNEKDDGDVVRENIVIKQTDEITFVSNVKLTVDAETLDTNYTAEIKVTLENGGDWNDVRDEITAALKDMTNTYADASGETVRVNIYSKGSGGIDSALIASLAGRDVKLSVNMPDGSEWRIDCGEVKEDVGTENFDMSHTVMAPTEETVKQLGTEDCFGLTFGASSNFNAETVVTLPSDTAYNTAHLYQVESDGAHTLLQSVKVDGDAKAHFYLASVDKDTNYVIGVNVPGESTDNVIVPDELMTAYGSVYERLNKIEYVTTGVKSSWGLSFAQVTWIMIGVIGVAIVSVGAVMTVINKKKQKKKREATAAQ